MQINTFSIVGYDAATQSWGVAVASKFLAVGAAVPYASAGAGAVATQSLANLSFGPDGLALMAQGSSASETLELLLQNDPDAEMRQVGLVDASGGSATFTGEGCFSWAGGLAGPGFAAQGNILTGADVLDAMVSAYHSATGELAECLYAALAAGDRAGGDRRGRQAAALLVVKPNGSYGGTTDRYLDLRVDNHRAPVEELGTLLELHHLFFGSTAPDARLTIDSALAAELQALLARLGYYAGPVNGSWDAPTQEAFFAFTSVENLEDRVRIADGLIDPPALAYIRQQFAGG